MNFLSPDVCVGGIHCVAHRIFLRKADFGSPVDYDILNQSRHEKIPIETRHREIPQYKVNKIAMRCFPRDIRSRLSLPHL